MLLEAQDGPLFDWKGSQKEAVAILGPLGGARLRSMSGTIGLALMEGTTRSSGGVRLDHAVDRAHCQHLRCGASHSSDPDPGLTPLAQGIVAEGPSDGYGSNIVATRGQGTLDFSPCVHLPGFHFG